MLGMLGRGGVGAGVESSAGRASPPAAVDHSGEGASPATGLARMVAARRTAGAGFTLVELLVAIALGVMLMGIVTITFARVSEVFNMATARIEAVQNGRVALDMLARDLDGACMDSAGRSFVADPDATTFGVTGAVNLPGFWFTTLTEGMPGAKVLYFIADPPSTAFVPQCRVLHRMVDPNIQAPENQPTNLTGADSMIAYGIRTWSLRYLERTEAQALAGSAGAWSASWRSLPGGAQAGRKPAAVLVHLEVIDRKGRLERAQQPVIMERVIRLNACGIDE